MKAATAILSLSFVLVFTASHAQKEEDIYLQIGATDGKTYIENYFKPLFNGVGYGFTRGWYHTAETHDPLGFDLMITTSIAFIPSSDLQFVFRNDDYSKMQLTEGDQAKLPTFFGPQEKSRRPELSVYDENDERLVRITAPPGAIDMKEEFGFNAVPVPMYQLGMGGIPGLDVKLRFLPKLNFGKATMSMFGLGFQYDVGHWFERLQHEDVSAAVLTSFNNMKIVSDLSYSDPATKSNEGVFRINGFSFQVIGSKQYLNLITIFGAVGFSRAGSRTQILGTYPVSEEYVELPRDPIDLRYGEGSMNATIGLTLKLLFINITASHTFQNYHVTTLGVGVSVK